VSVTATVVDAANPISAVEGFVGTVGPAGSGFDLVPSDGHFDSSSETVLAEIPVTTLDGVADGSHSVYVRGQDDQGNWGEASGANLVIDRTPPELTGVTASPNPTEGAASVTLSASASGGVSNIVACEWFEGIDPGPGNAAQMAALDGAYDSPSEVVSATIDTRSWNTGTHAMLVRAVDGAGNWSPLVNISLTVTVANNVNQPPVAGDDAFSAPYWQKGKYTAQVLDVLTNDSDVDGNLDPASVNIVSAPSQGGTIAVNTDGTLSYTPMRRFNGVETFSYMVRDAFEANSNAATVTVTVQ